MGYCNLYVTDKKQNVDIMELIPNMGVFYSKN